MDRTESIDVNVAGLRPIRALSCDEVDAETPALWGTALIHEPLSSQGRSCGTAGWVAYAHSS